MLEFTKTDLARCDTVMKALKRGKYELEGEEVLAFAQAFAWLSAHYELMKNDIEAPPIPKPVAVELKKGKK